MDRSNAMPTRRHRRTGQRGGVRIGVTGVGGGVGQSIVRALRIWDAKPHLVGFDMNPDSAGLFFCDAGHVLPPCSHVDYLQRLLECCVEEGIEILIPGSDPELLPLSLARKEFADRGVRVLVSSPDVIRIARDKFETCVFLNACSVPFARTERLSSIQDSREAWDFPLIVKPADGSASRNVRVLFDRESLLALEPAPGMIVQEYLLPENWGLLREELADVHVYYDGTIRQHDEVSIQFLLSADGTEFGTFTSLNKLRNGVPMVIEPRSMPDVVAVARRGVTALAKLGLVGPCNLQGRLTADGIVFFEVNTRFTGISAVRARMGFREVEAAVRNRLFGETGEQLSPILRQPEDLAGLRYVTEEIIRAEDLAVHRQGTTT
jgi:carbamoylphosphate synthase large subunit